VIADTQACVLRGGRQTKAVYREFAKTTIAENTILWATLNGYRDFALIVGLNKAASTANIDSIKSELAENDLLAEDYPEACFPIRALEGKPQLAPNQRVGGRRTKIVWQSETIRLPEIEGSRCSGAIIAAKPFSRARGVKAKRSDGVNARPDLVLVDDIEDDESAASPRQVHKNLMVLKKQLVHLGRHDKPLALIVNGTTICRGCMIDALLSDPAWEGERFKFVQKWADSHETFWLKEYAGIRRTFSRHVTGDKERAEREATALYLSRRAEADAGCIVSWEERYTRPKEISAIQHAYNVLIDDGPEVFASEYQNEPLDERTGKSRLTAALVASKTNGLARGVVPKTAEYVTANIDVHLRVLYYVIAAWSKPFQGAVIDYGTYPRQPVSYFAQATAPVGMDDLARAAGGMSEEAWILAGLQRLTEQILGAVFIREDGAEHRVGQLLIDARWGQTNPLVKQFCRRHPANGTRVMAAQGYGSGTRKPPLRTLPLKPGTMDGTFWRILPPTSGDRWVTIDTNASKTLLASRLALPLGTAGGIELFGIDPREHTLFADHCTAEAPEEITAGGLTYEVWDWLLPHQDNHWWDCLVGAMVAAMKLGCYPEELAGQRRRFRNDPASRPSAAELATGR
jgi:hypothetical protein